jgi:toxin ParE1/3/4
MTVLARARALMDLDEIAEQIGRTSPRAALRFLDAFDQTAAALAVMPALGSPHDSNHPRLRNVRVRPVKKFKNHLIFYLPITDGIEVLRVLHGARDIPGILEGEDGPQ